VSPAYLDFLYSLGEFNIKLGLHTIRTMLSRLGDPHLHPRIIHIAGTNGKGSTLATLERLLLESGYTTGSTISPHLISFNERYRINGQAVTSERLDHAFRCVCRECDISLDLSQSGSRDGKLNPTFFEFALAMAFVLFEDSGVDYILLETGLGGRLDATNVVEQPLACVLTRIALDHQEYLGNTIEQITLEKLGILKKSASVFVAPQQKEVSRTIQSYCESKGHTAYWCPKDFFMESGASGTFFSFSRSICSRSSNSLDWRRIFLSRPGLLGEHQYENIMTALAVYQYIVTADKQLNEKTIIRTIANLKWPGRLQYLGKAGKILLDGAHNASGMHALLTYLTTQASEKRILFALGWMKNKNLLSVFDTFRFKNLIFVPVEIDNKRSEKGANISRALINKKWSVLPSRKTQSLVKNEIDGILPDHDLLVVAGSLYLVGEFLTAWQNAEMSALSKKVKSSLIKPILPKSVLS